MSRESVIVVLGIVLALSPFLGLPYAWLMVLVPVLALLAAAVALSLRARRTRESAPVYDAQEA